MATIKVLNAMKANLVAPVEVKLGIVNEEVNKPINAVGIPGPQGPKGDTGPTGDIGLTGPQGPKGDTPIKGVDYFTTQEINEITAPLATKIEVQTAINEATSGLLKRSIVQELPVVDIDSNTIYMVPKNGDIGDIYDEYLYVNNVWEHIGSTDIDLTGYATEDYVNDRKFPYLDLKKLIQKSGVRWNYNTSPPSWRAERDASNPYITELFNIFEYALNNGYYLENYSGIYFDGYIYYPHSNMNGYTTISIQNWQNGLWGWTLKVSINNNYLIISNQQNFQPTLYEAGTGISISNSTISINTQYLTNSDILAIWNGENEE